MSCAWTRSRLPRASFASRKRTGRRSRRTVRGSPQPLTGSCLCRRRLEAAVRSACLLSACSREPLRPRVPPMPRRQPSPAISLFRRSSRRCARHSGRRSRLPRSPSRRPVSPSPGHCPLRSSGAAANASVFRWSSNASVFALELARPFEERGRLLDRLPLVERDLDVLDLDLPPVALWAIRTLLPHPCEPLLSPITRICRDESDQSRLIASLRAEPGPGSGIPT